MNEKGFATIFGLCLILAIALIVKGIQESEMNHAYETANFETELKLKNAAEVGIFKAAAEIKNNQQILPLQENFTIESVEVWSEGTDKTDYKISVEVSSEGTDKTDYTLSSTAEIENKHTGEISYRRAFAYVKDNVIHFTK